MILKTDAIVLKHFDFRETSRIATFFTKEFGKVKGVLKGIRKDPRKFGSSIDKFSVNHVVYYQYRNSDLHLISHCDMKKFYGPIRQDLKKMTAASYVLELIDVVMPQEEKNEEIYTLVLDFLKSLQTTDDVSKLVHLFQIKVLLLSGFRPHLDPCVKCEKKVAGEARFSMSLGGLVCDHCRIPDGQLTLISRGAVASIMYVERNDWSTSVRLKIDPVIQKELKFVLNNFLVFHLERHLKSTKYLT